MIHETCSPLELIPQLQDHSGRGPALSVIVRIYTFHEVEQISNSYQVDFSTRLSSGITYESPEHLKIELSQAAMVQGHRFKRR